MTLTCYLKRQSTTPPNFLGAALGLILGVFGIIFCVWLFLVLRRLHRRRKCRRENDELERFRQNITTEYIVAERERQARNIAQEHEVEQIVSWGTHLDNPGAFLDLVGVVLATKRGGWTCPFSEPLAAAVNEARREYAQRVLPPGAPLMDMYTGWPDRWGAFPENVSEEARERALRMFRFGPLHEDIPDPRLRGPRGRKDLRIRVPSPDFGLRNVRLVRGTVSIPKPAVKIENRDLLMSIPLMKVDSPDFLMDIKLDDDRLPEVPPGDKKRLQYPMDYSISFPSPATEPATISPSTAWQFLPLDDRCVGCRFREVHRCPWKKLTIGDEEDSDVERYECGTLRESDFSDYSGVEDTATVQTLSPGRARYIRASRGTKLGAERKVVTRLPQAHSRSFQAAVVVEGERHSVERFTRGLAMREIMENRKIDSL